MAIGARVQTSYDPIRVAGCGRDSRAVTEGRSTKRTRMAARSYTAVLLPSDDRVKSVSSATDGGSLLGELGEQKTGLTALQ